MTPVDLYCERVGPGLLGEPLNATTNAAFLIAALLAWRYASQSNKLTNGVVLLFALVIAFGLGSTLFHTFADTLTRWLDVLPIAAFTAAYFWLYVRRLLDGSVAIATLATVIFVFAAAAARQFPDILNGSVIYAPALALVTGLGLHHLFRARHEAAGLIGAAAALFIAVFFRTIDNWVCADVTIGTHFLWHLFAALALYLAMRAFIANLLTYQAPQSTYRGRHGTTGSPSHGPAKSSLKRVDAPRLSHADALALWRLGRPGPYSDAQGCA